MHLPKAAGVSICTSLFGGLAGGHTPIGVYQIVFSRREFDRYFKFAFVRNPWDRLLSAYTFLKSGGWDESDRRTARFLAPFSTFEEFVERWVTERTVLTHIHFVPQYRFVCEPFSARMAVDFVGRYEHLERDFAVVRERLKLDAAIELPHHNQGAAKSVRDFRDCYTTRTREIVARVYRRDVELFDYAFE